MKFTDFVHESVSIPVPLIFALIIGATVVVTSKAANSEVSKTIEDKVKISKATKANEAQSPTKQTDYKGPNHSPVINRAAPYRIEEEDTKRQSSEYTRRGQLWSRHASWHLPDAPRNSQDDKYKLGQGFEHVRSLLKKFDVDPITGFLPSDDPLQRLPYARYHLWEDLADDLPKLLGARLGQARAPLKALPVLSTDKLVTDADLRRAHLLLCLFAHAYVWGGNTPMDHIPEGIAMPLWEVSEKLGIPPILGHTSIVLYNWRRLDVNGAICMENLSTLNNFFDGRDESWFYLITVEIEAKGAPGIVPVLLVNDAIQRFREEKQFSNSLSTSGKSLPLSTQSSDGFSEEDLDISAALVGELTAKRVATYAAAQLRIVAEAIRGMCDSLTAMREGCHPFIFYHRVRPFLSGWKHNPTMPNGLLYEGVSDQRMQFYGGSAAQSALIPFLDISFGVTHESNKSKEFLLAMRDYMLRPHREFLAYLEKVSCIRSFVLEQLAAAESLKSNVSDNASYLSAVQDLKEAYDLCVQFIQRFRTGHISIVSEYIMAQQKQHAKSQGLENTAGGKGTGGTDLMNFLKPLRDDCTNKIISADRNAEGDDGTAPVSSPNKVHKNSDVYVKTEGSIKDIDIFQSGVRGSYN